MELTYTGAGGNQWVPGWPAADHEEDDADVAAAKIASGLYEAAKPPRERAPAAPATTDKE